MKQNRFKSTVLWTALAAQIISLGQLTGLWKELGIDAGALGNIVALVLQICVTVGVLNDATNPKGW